MGEETKIELCDHSWSPWRGCTKVSPGCANSYAETLSKRNPAVLGQWGRGKPRVLAKNWGEPLKWNRAVEMAWDEERAAGLKVPRATVFPSLCDWLDDEVPVEWLARFLKLIHDTPNLTWLLLTNRPENFGRRVSLAAGFLGELGEKGDESASGAWGMTFDWIDVTGPSNVWVGTSVEDQTRADQRIPALLKIPAVGRFLSVEPLLGSVEFTRQTVFGSACMLDEPIQHNVGRSKTGNVKKGIHWVIIGGESGPSARPCNIEWIRTLVGQCKAAGVPAFVKQLGARARDLVHDEDGNPLGIKHLVLTHPKGGDAAEWPEDLRVRQFPEGLR